MADTVIIITAQDQATDALNKLAQNFQRTGNDIESSFGGSVQKINGYVTEFLAFAGVSVSLKGLYDLASGWEDMTFQMKAVFGNRADEMIQIAQNLSDKTNTLFSTMDFAKALATSSDVLQRFGLTGSEEIDLVGRAADIAAARGKGLDETVAALAKSLQGGGRGAIQFGLSLSDAYMKSVAFGGALKDIWDSLDSTDKAGLKYQEFLNQTGKYSGDAADKTNTLSGAIQAYANQLKAAITIGGPKSVLSDVVGGVPVVGDALASMLKIVDAEKQLGEATEKQKDASAAFYENLSSTSSLMNKLTAQQADYLDRGPSKEADKQRDISLELTKQQSLQERLKEIGADRAQAAQQLAAAEEALEQAPFSMELLSPDYGLQRDIIRDIASLRGRISTDDQNIFQTEELIKASLENQKQLEWDQVSATAAKAQAIANAAAQSGTSSEFQSAAFQKDVSVLLNDQEAAQKRIIALEQQRFNLENAMQNGGLDSDQYAADAAQLDKVNTEMQRQGSIADWIGGVLSGLELKRQQTLQDGGGIDKVNKGLAELETQLQQLEAQKPSIDFSDIQTQLDSLNEKATQFGVNVQAAITKATSQMRTTFESGSLGTLITNQDPNRTPFSADQLSPMPYVDYGAEAAKAFTDGWKAILSDGPPVKPQVDATQAQSAFNELNSVVNQVRANIEQGATFTVDMMMAMSPAQPFSTGYSQLMQRFQQIPTQMQFTINTLMAGGASASSAISTAENLQKYAAIIAQDEKMLQMANLTAIELQAVMQQASTTAGYIGTVSLQSAENELVFARDYVQAHSDELYEAQLQYAEASGQASSSGSSSSGSTGTTTSTTQAQIALNIVNNIYSGSSGSARDDAITLAAKVTDSIVSDITNKRSRIVAALISAGVISKN